MQVDKTILITGVTGYVGSCLVPRVLQLGARVRVLGRNLARSSEQPWFRQVEQVEGNTLDPAALARAMQGISTAYYLVHNMSSGRNYFESERQSAALFASQAAAAGVEQIIYLGGLANPADELGRHLRSRLQTGDVLRAGSVPVTEFRASLVIGSGSISFEMIRYLGEQFPILPGPKWMHRRTQPISIENVLDYLVAALDNPLSLGKVYEIGGSEVLSYADTLAVYASLRGLKRKMFTFPWPGERLMAHIAARVTPVPVSIAGPLLDGMRSDSIVRDTSARQDFPQVQPMGYRQAVEQALECLVPDCLEPVLKNRRSSFRIKQKGFFIECQQVFTRACPQEVFQVLAGLGGKDGWLYMNWLWKLRSWLDGLAGGPGLRRKPDGQAPEVGGILDFYRVELLEPGRRLRLKAELKAPGSGWMDWQLSPQDGGTWLSQRAFFAPRGLPGFIYWYLLLPIHRLVFSGLVKAIVRRVEKTSGGADPCSSQRGEP